MMSHLLSIKGLGDICSFQKTLNKMIFCLTIIDLSFDVFDYKKKVQGRQRKDKKIRTEHERDRYIVRVLDLGSYVLPEKIMKVIKKLILLIFKS